MPTEKDYKVIEKATIYDLRRLIKNSDKDTYTKRELCDLLDTIADVYKRQSPSWRRCGAGPRRRLNAPIWKGFKYIYGSRMKGLSIYAQEEKI